MNNVYLSKKIKLVVVFVLSTVLSVAILFSIVFAIMIWKKDVVIFEPYDFSEIYIEDQLLEKYGDDYARILDYVGIEFGKYFVARVYMVESNMEQVKSIGSDISGLLNFVHGFQYQNSNSDPSRIVEMGGNCQALSVFVMDWAIEFGYKYRMVFDSLEHMYCEVESEDLVYQFDTKEGGLNLQIVGM